MPAPMKVTSQGLWQGDDPLHFALPLLRLQTCIVIVFTRTLHVFIFKPLKQPRVIAEIIEGILLGPSDIGRNTDYLNTIFPKQSLTTFETVANIGLLFFVFLVGLELNLNTSGGGTARKAIIIAIAGIALPFALGASTSLVVHATISKGARLSAFFVFMGASFSITAIPIVAGILAEFKLLETEVGRMALSAAAINDITAWILLALAIALSGPRSPLVSVWILLTAVAYVVLLIVLLRPILAWMGRCTVDGSLVIAEKTTLPSTHLRKRWLQEKLELQKGKEALCESIKMVKRCNIFLVGHSPPVNALIDITDCTELGPIGSYLASSESSTMASALVIKRHALQGDSLPLSDKLVEEAANVDTKAIPVHNKTIGAD
ncbi:hypothetical protein LUZ63_005171 [Rhynchospora breviuscula]|uniref:Cation/H+ exchanger transmembrane domain-containing protein n=1 Tax=Rhynchospora breviuscula TaxID=2022672 RepID=A0A9Q0HSC7_9POAL|nr:hypothetical protein LUZ63_005171 [Rhynchospora breviuscula]